ncbi:Peroxisome biogenesis factor 10 [Colletotrichum chlorophyti]|uniref:RING-type E3 ubiquitin transferase n=1 Tax=Colletotrichum chlorophyti TaxID=708187 RepID=A0A1Q8RVL5_9PEZI|nr:Peroxisome biogenesis factor 10 [Colletotrichum chlorophyti]
MTSESSPSRQTSSSTSNLPSSPYPYASAPDIIRAHQKDAYYKGYLSNNLASLHRLLLGARSAHASNSLHRLLADTLYLSLTTLPGNRTLGEEYCDLVQLHVTPTNSALPTLPRRASYILTSVLLPYLLGRTLPTLAKRLLGFRYVFTRRVPDTPDRAGYEVLGVLLVAQLAVQSYLHIRTTISDLASTSQSAAAAAARERERISAPPDVSLDANAYAANTAILLSETGTPGGSGSGTSRVDVAAVTHTPVAAGGDEAARFDLADEKVMAYISGAAQRKCTLCLEELKDPSATQCGHVFCWTCIGDWVREKPECPLCRREAMVQHILPLRVA